MIAGLPQDAWQALCAGEGAKGQRLYDWARVPLSYTSEAGLSRWVLARRSLRNPDKQAYYPTFPKRRAGLCKARLNLRA